MAVEDGIEPFIDPLEQRAGGGDRSTSVKQQRGQGGEQRGGCAVARGVGDPEDP